MLSVVIHKLCCSDMLVISIFNTPMRSQSLAAVFCRGWVPNLPSSAHRAAWNHSTQHHHGAPRLCQFQHESICVVQSLFWGKGGTRIRWSRPRGLACVELKQGPHQRPNCIRKDRGPGWKAQRPRDDCAQLIKVTGLADNKKQGGRGGERRKSGGSRTREREREAQDVSEPFTAFCRVRLYV